MVVNIEQWSHNWYIRILSEVVVEVKDLMQRILFYWTAHRFSNVSTSTEAFIDKDLAEILGWLSPILGSWMPDRKTQSIAKAELTRWYTKASSAVNIVVPLGNTSLITISITSFTGFISIEFGVRNRITWPFTELPIENSTFNRLITNWNPILHRHSGTNSDFEHLMDYVFVIGCF